MRFLDRTRATLEELRSLAPSPFRYGSRSRIPDFPRRDPLSWVAKIALTNHISQSPRLRAGTSMELTNLAKGSSSCLLRADDRGWTPELYGLERCIHVRDLIRRIGGTV